MGEFPKRIKNFICPLCREKTLVTQGDVVWCENLGQEHDKSCQFGFGTGEKLISDVAAEQKEAVVQS